MKERCFGISYLFTPTPNAEEVAKKGEIIYNPLVVYKEEGETLQTMRSKSDFRIGINDIATDYMFLAEQKSFYKEMQKHSRAAQERIISKYICTIILNKVRTFCDDDLTFLIRDEFQTEKIIGRLGYLGLPMQRVHILFVSYHLASFMGNYIEHYSVPPKSDLNLLFQEEYRGKILGPYPDDDVVTMLKTFYCSFGVAGGADFYPVRVNLFSQTLKKDEINKENIHIKKVFMESKAMETWPISGGKGSENTRLPGVLVDCENYIEGEKKKYE